VPPDVTMMAVGVFTNAPSLETDETDSNEKSPGGDARNCVSVV